MWCTKIQIKKHTHTHTHKVSLLCSSMAESSSTQYNNFFSSLISEIKLYSGKDPLVPWLRGIRKMKDTIPPQILKEKLPRFLQKCAQTFLTDRRYTNDLRYLRVWLQLLDFVDDPGAALGTMKANQIGMRKSLFYQACALYYEKVKNFEEAEKMYHLGVKNLAEPMEELQKSFEEFIQRMERHKNKRIERKVRIETRPCAGFVSLNCNEDKGENETKGMPIGNPHNKSLSEAQLDMENKVPLPQSSRSVIPGKESEPLGTMSNLDRVEIHNDPSLKNGNSLKHNNSRGAEHQNRIGEDTVVVKFVGSAIVGKSRAEDACHHGLLEPTINTKEAMNAINSMFHEPLEPARASTRSHKSRPKTDQISANGFEVFVDENLGNGTGASKQKLGMSFPKPSCRSSESHQPHQEPLQIFIDEVEDNDMAKIGCENYNKHKEVQGLNEGAPFSGRNASTFLNPPSEISEDLDVERFPRTKVREDTVVYRFVGSTISEEPNVENVCHHGLVEPTINLKEAMNDINSMFGKPIEFARKNRPRKHDKAQEKKRDCGGFSILPDDEIDNKQGKKGANSSSRSETDLFEQTVCTKEAMAEINELFRMPLDF